MTPTPQDLLAQCAQFLRNAAPAEFDQFKRAFADYSIAVAKTLVDAPEDLPRYQGHAQQCQKILQVLERMK